MAVMTGYIYDAEGNRVAKGAITTMSCDPSANGFTAQADYVLDQAGRQLSEFVPGQNGTMAWQHTNVYASGELIATDDTTETHYYLNDWLGTRRVQTDYEGVVEQTCSSLPYGDGETCAPAPTENLFTGKERDSESGNDYFGARYYGSTMGRFLSPDPSGLYYANPANPQSFNLYTYGLNNPLTNTDPTGLDCVYFNDAGNGVESVDHNSNSGECGQNGGDWVNGTTSANQIQYDPNSDTFNIQSSSTFYNYNSTAYAPGPGGGGTDSNGNPIACSGNCDTENGYQSSFKIPGFTLQLGLSVNLGVMGPFTLTGFSGFVLDSHGHLGTYSGGGGGLSAGAGASGGVQFGASNGNSVCAISGPFANGSITAGAGGGGTLDGFVGYGDGPRGVVSGGSVTVGAAGGADTSATITGTSVHPFGGHQCVNGKLQ